jgi:hypothetical protein
MTYQNQPTSGDPTGRYDILNTIHEGMAVYDSTGDRIGEVDFVYFGASTDTQQELGTGPAGLGAADSVQMREDSLVDAFAEVFDPGEVPEELREKLMQSGYIRLDADGLFAADRFITPEQIASVREEDVELNVTRDQLIKRR